MEYTEIIDSQADDLNPIHTFHNKNGGNVLVYMLFTGGTFSLDSCKLSSFLMALNNAIYSN